MRCVFCPEYHVKESCPHRVVYWQGKALPAQPGNETDKHWARFVAFHGGESYEVIAEREGVRVAAIRHSVEWTAENLGCREQESGADWDAFIVATAETDRMIAASV